MYSPGFYPRGNPPAGWDEEGDEIEQSPEKRQPGRLSKVENYGVVLLISVFVSLLPLGIIFYMMEKVGIKLQEMGDFKALRIIFSIQAGTIAACFVALTVLLKKIGWFD